jgi:uncharacterized damage-inducible protein DinB
MPGYLAGERPDTRGAGGERELLAAFLDWYRTTLELKCADLDADALAMRAVPPSELSLLGLVRHMAEVEAGWFRDFTAEAWTPRYPSADGPGGDFDATPDPAATADAFAYWRAEVAHAREILAAHELDDVTVFRLGEREQEFSLRWIVVHMIEEYARHCGHADMLRERIDGATGY